MRWAPNCLLCLLCISTAFNQRLSAVASASLHAAEAADQAASSQNSTLTPDSVEQLQALMTRIVRDSVPTQYENRKQWGTTKEVVRGLSIRREGLRIETKRRKKPVNHGTWKMYRIRLVDPDEQFQLRVLGLRPIREGRLGIDAYVDARLNVFGRISQWQTGLQLISLSADAQAQVRLRVQAEVELRLDPAKIPPDLVLEAVVTDAALQLRDFRLYRLSNLRGPLAKQLGKAMREVLEDELASRRHKLVSKLNRQIEKNQDKLRLSLHDVVSATWKKLLQDGP